MNEHSIQEWILCDQRLPEPGEWYMVYGCRLKPLEYKQSPTFEDKAIHTAYLINNKWYDVFTAPVYATHWIKLPGIPP